MKTKRDKSINVVNRKASFEYSFLEKFEAGIVLTGTEIKSIRENSANISDAYCYIKGGEIFVKNMHISMLKNAGDMQHEPLRERKLLLTKKEIRKIENELKNQGITMILVSLFTNKTGLVKMNVALAKGKKLFDKRNNIKEKQIIRDIARELS